MGHSRKDIPLPRKFLPSRGGREISQDVGSRGVLMQDSLRGRGKFIKPRFPGRGEVKPLGCPESGIGVFSISCIGALIFSGTTQYWSFQIIFFLHAFSRAFSQSDFRDSIRKEERQD